MSHSCDSTPVTELDSHPLLLRNSRQLPAPLFVLAFLCSVVAAIGSKADVHASTFIAPPLDIGIIGSVQKVVAREGESLVDVTRRYRLGQEEIRLANPTLPRWLLLRDQDVLLPTRYVLPAAPRRGIVVNLPERRLYDYTGRVDGVQTIRTFPVSVGRMDWATQLGDTAVVSRRKDPDWTPPESIRTEALLNGRSLPPVVPAGPTNPLGRHAIYLGWPGYLLHGTNNTNAIGLRVTHGCIRLYPQDIETLFHVIPDGTPVRFVNEPVKAGWFANALWLEVHPPLEERQLSDDELLDTALSLVTEALRERGSPRIHTTAIRRAVERRDGVPVMLELADLSRQP